MNNFVFGDPLLYRQIVPQNNELRQQLDNMNTQYNQLQSTRDYLGELDGMVKGLDSDILSMLQSDETFLKYNSQIQQRIQDEILNTVKWRINNDPGIISAVESLKTIIENTRKQKEENNRQNINEINDYIQNYSDMTFSEYKKLKNEGK